MADLPVPLILPSGETVPIDVDDYFPGDPLPKRIHRYPDGTNFVYDAQRDAYVKDTTHVLPVSVIYPNGDRAPVELSWWWPGDPYPRSFRQAGVLYVYDRRRGAYVRAGSEERHPRFWATCAVSVPLSWFYAMPIAVVASQTRGSDGINSTDPGMMAFVWTVIVLLVTVIAHAIRTRRAEAHNSRYRY